jgi:prepilin-type N-terminal cleavage/methylation domain-containing protein
MKGTRGWLPYARSARHPGDSRGWLLFARSARRPGDSRGWLPYARSARRPGDSRGWLPFARSARRPGDSRGFTLIELLIALTLAALVVGGALQLHVSFNRQSQRQQTIAELQQTLRVSMLVLARALRQAGTGLPPGMHAFPAMIGTSCTSTSYYGFSFSNNNAYADPVTQYYTAGPNQDSDPDWFRIVASDTAQDNGATIDSSGAVWTYIDGQGVQNWNPGDLFIVLDKCAGCQGQIREITKGYNGTTPPAAGIQHHKGGSCYNLAPGNCPQCDKCLGNGGCASPGAPIRHFSGTSTVFRVTSKADANYQDPPKLTMAQPAFGTAASQVQWTALADNIEDMQIAIILQDGTVCTYVDDPAMCNFANAVAVRITLVARSRGTSPNATPSPVGGYEDEPQVPMTAPGDGYIRRAMTTTVQLRNFL